MFVRIMPGQMALRVMFSRGRCLPKERTKPTTALGRKVRWLGRKEDMGWI
jgi:hypothetical protein